MAKVRDPAIYRFGRRVADEVWEIVARDWPALRRIVAKEIHVDRQGRRRVDRAILRAAAFARAASNSSVQTSLGLPSAAGKI
ncbi:MAG TPA: hypothetical protein VFF67_08655 [Thermoplasmata archaeon]|nr:hypothetical protein [Thermoplasmata archaeon]